MRAMALLHRFSNSQSSIVSFGNTQTDLLNQGAWPREARVERYMGTALPVQQLLTSRSLAEASTTALVPMTQKMKNNSGQSHFNSIL